MRYATIYTNPSWPSNDSIVSIDCPIPEDGQMWFEMSDDANMPNGVCIFMATKPECISDEGTVKTEIQLGMLRQIVNIANQ